MNRKYHWNFRKNFHRRICYFCKYIYFLLQKINQV